MNRMMDWTRNDTICAVATAVGGAICVIRVSGKRAIEVVDGVFSGDLKAARAHSMHYGQIAEGNCDGGERHIVDDVMVAVFRAPRSYTGEDCAEISCHGSRYIVNKVLELLINGGCRMAERGEFTMRAYLNGKMDLSQAEAVADLIASSNKATHDIAMAQLRGGFSSELALLRSKLLELTSLLELEIDFSDHEDLEFADRKELSALAEKIETTIAKLIDSFKTGMALKRGIPVAIVGKTNVGKSTLLNRLLRDDRAIVSNTHGTTRDVIEDTMEINGVSFRFIDTAGLRQTTDEVEQLGIERTYKKMREADIVVWVSDARPSVEEIREMESLTAGKQLIAVQNKADLNREQEAWKEGLLRISAKNDENIDTLEQLIYSAANIPEIKENDVIITSARHYEALTKARQSILRVLKGMEEQRSGDLIAEDLRDTLSYLSDITGGEITTNEVLENIFKNFCVGK